MTIMLRTIGGLLFVLLTECAVAGERPPEFALWIDQSPNRSEAYGGEWDGHPCGEVAILHADVIPEFESGALLQPEQVHEVDAKGAVLRTWVVPVDAEPIAISGEQLYINLHRDTYVIGLDRAIRKSALPQEQVDSAKSACVVPDHLLMGAYGACAAFRDGNSGNSRYLVFRMICS